MRTDPSRDANFLNDQIWDNMDKQVVLFERASNEDGPGPSFRSSPFSGNERNRIFFRRGDNFEDLTLVSGADFREDGRGFAMLDFDNDGWVDLGIVSPNHPRFRIVSNKIGKLKESNGFVEVSLVGGQTTIEPSTEWSCLLYTSPSPRDRG